MEDRAEERLIEMKKQCLDNLLVSKNIIEELKRKQRDAAIQIELLKDKYTAIISQAGLTSLSTAKDDISGELYKCSKQLVEIETEIENVEREFRKKVKSIRFKRGEF